MGSFDAVCGLSNMAIGCGDPVIAMMIRRNPWQSYPNSPIRPYDTWQPASVLVRGRYDDYGNVEIDDDARAAWGLTQKSAMKSWQRVWREEIKTHTGHVIPAQWGHDPITLDQTFDNSGEAPDRDDGEFAIWMAHAAIWEHLTRDLEIEWFSHGGASMTDVKVSTAVDTVFESNRNLMGASQSDLALGYTRNPWRAGSSDHDPVSDYYEDAIWDAYQSGDMEFYNRLTLHWRDSMLLGNIMYQLRRTLCPPGTIGPQHGHDQPHLALAEAIREQAARNKAKYAEFEDEDGE